MNILMKLAPHAVILIGNMYYVFWGIDRVNKSMNFIDNPYTKFLLLIMILCSAVNTPKLFRIHLNRLRRTDNPVPVFARLGTLALSTLLAAVIFVLLVIDLFGEDLLLFLNEFVKALILILSVTGLLNSLQLTARDRALVRYEMRRRAQARLNAPLSRPTPQPARYASDSRVPRQPTRAPQQRPSGDYRRSQPSARPSGDYRGPQQPARYGSDYRRQPQQRSAPRPSNRY